MSDILYVVIPCYNEQEVLPETARRLKEKMTALIGSGIMLLILPILQKAIRKA